MGLVNEMVAPEKLLGRARELAASLLSNSPASLLATKRLLTRYAAESLDPRDRGRGGGERAHPQDGRFPGGCKLVSGEAKSALDREIAGAGPGELLQVRTIRSRGKRVGLSRGKDHLR